MRQIQICFLILGLIFINNLSFAEEKPTTDDKPVTPPAQNTVIDWTSRSHKTLKNVTIKGLKRSSKKSASLIKPRFLDCGDDCIITTRDKRWKKRPSARSYTAYQGSRSVMQWNVGSTGKLHSVRVPSRFGWVNFSNPTDPITMGLAASAPQASKKIIMTMAADKAVSTLKGALDTDQKPASVFDKIQKDLEAASSKVKKLENATTDQDKKDLAEAKKALEAADKKKTDQIVSVLKIQKNEESNGLKKEELNSDERAAINQRIKNLDEDIKLLDGTFGGYYRYNTYIGRYGYEEVRNKITGEQKTALYDQMAGTHINSGPEEVTNGIVQETISVRHGDTEPKALQRRNYRVDGNNKTLIDVSFLEPDGKWSNFAASDIPPAKKKEMESEDKRVKADSKKQNSDTPPAKSAAGADTSADDNESDEPGLSDDAVKAFLTGLLKNKHTQCSYNEDYDDQAPATDLNTMALPASCSEDDPKKDKFVCIGKVYCTTEDGDGDFEPELSVACASNDGETCPDAKKCALSNDIALFKNAGQAGKKEKGSTSSSAY